MVERAPKLVALDPTAWTRVRTRWRALSRLRRAALAVVAAVVLAGGAWLGLGRWAEWPARARLRTPGATWPLAFSPDSRTFATSDGSRVTLWDAADGRARATWELGRPRPGIVGAFSPDGRTFVAAVDGHPQPISVAWVDVATGRLKFVRPTQSTGIYSLSFTPDGRGLRAFLGDVPDLKQAITWDAESGRETSNRPLTCPKGRHWTAISPDGHLLAMAAIGGSVVELWDLDADRPLGVLSDRPSPPPLAAALGFSEDGRTLAIGLEDGTIELWDVPGRTLRRTLQGHTPGYNSWWIRFAPDGRTLASHGALERPASLVQGLHLELMRAVVDKAYRPAPEVVVLDVATGRRLARAGSAIHPRFSPDGRTLATREEDLSVRLRDVPARAD
jgi:WD40 repeat protein